jgi:hypothetical protein
MECGPRSKIKSEEDSMLLTKEYKIGDWRAQGRTELSRTELDRRRQSRTR